MKSFEQFLAESSYGSLETAKQIIQVLRTAGYQAYLVGGCVRDMLLHRTPKDFDVATDATPDHVLKMFPHADRVGAHFGVVIEKGVEIATFRSDGVYGDGRRPDTVQFEKNPREDAARRDFTVNSMFLDPFTGHVLDFFGGQEDIKSKTLKAVGDPAARFEEDHLRMMRAVRFASKLDFDVEPSTMDAMKDHAHSIKSTAPERTTDELVKSLDHNPAKTFVLLQHSHLLFQVLPELESMSAHELQVVSQVMARARTASSNVALAAIFSKMSVKHVPAILNRLKLSNEQSGHVLGILNLLPRITGLAPQLRPTLDVTKKVMRDRFFSDALWLFGALAHVENDHIDLETFEHLSKWFPQMKADDLNPPKLVTGTDLLDLGLKAGKQFKEILDAIEVAQLTGAITSREEAMAIARKMGKVAFQPISIRLPILTGTTDC